MSKNTKKNVQKQETSNTPVGDQNVDTVKQGLENVESTEQNEELTETNLNTPGDFSIQLAPGDEGYVDTNSETKSPMADLEPSIIDTTPVLERDKATSDVFRMRSSALKELTAFLDKPQAPNFANPQVKAWYTSIFREIVACLNVEKTSDLNALMNFILKLMKDNERVYGVRRVFGPLQTLTISDKDLRFYEEIFNVLIMVDSGAKISKQALDEKFNGLLNADKSERFAKWVIAKQG